jgi:hypothetical protein
MPYKGLGIADVRYDICSPDLLLFGAVPEAWAAEIPTTLADDAVPPHMRCLKVDVRVLRARTLYRHETLQFIVYTKNQSD